MYQKGLAQFIPFIATILGVLFTDLLKGIAIGIVIAVFYVLKRNYQNHFTLEHTEHQMCMILSEEVTFLNKGGIMEAIHKAKGKKIIIDASRTKSIDLDVLEALHELKLNADLAGQQEIQFINL
jgi:MFS superfamily sulfate permease-like transporter